jgi:hypothetical protein
MPVSRERDGIALRLAQRPELDPACFTSRARPHVNRGSPPLSIENS